LYIDDTCYSRTRTSFRIRAHFLYVFGGIELSHGRCGRRVRLTVEMGHHATFIKKIMCSYYFRGNKTTFVVSITYECKYLWSTLDNIWNFFNRSLTQFIPQSTNMFKLRLPVLWAMYKYNVYECCPFPWTLAPTFWILKRHLEHCCA